MSEFSLSLSLCSIQGGCINALAFSPCGRFLVAAIGREHKSGRWWCDQGAKNRLFVIAMRQTALSDSNQTSYARALLEP